MSEPADNNDTQPATGTGGIHPAVIALGLLVFAAAVAVAAKSGIWLARDLVPDEAVQSSTIVFRPGTEVKLWPRANFYVAAFDIRVIRKFTYERTARPDLKIESLDEELMFLDGGEQLQVVEDHADVVQFVAVDGQLTGRTVFIDKNQVEDLAP